MISSKLISYGLAIAATGGGPLIIKKFFSEKEKTEISTEYSSRTDMSNQKELSGIPPEKENSSSCIKKKEDQGICTNASEKIHQ